MSLLTTVNEDIKTAMKARDKETLAVLRMIKSSLQNEEIKKGSALNEEEELTVLSREMKQRRESLTEFKSAGRDDLVEKLEKEIAIVERYLPKQLSEDELRAIVKKTADRVQASSMKDFGKVMGAVMSEIKGQADGNEVNRLVKEQLS
ncbi:GatB/YqeY domain-containing protein [Pisciglobus halotolerans]|uniref:GatB/YqeY domain-containing protein n=1 Tax=Pisciglobus halotolerans TaxID=745365 RepID=A0A1I3B9R8_9LACT|nr:GatB/YqeY domain-containing protein [Pisciglobus halotolerans]SFH59024.1 hypothetical protein SAMN04489868_1053 [Pisciglobus halotolerans]